MNILAATWRQHVRIVRSYPAAMVLVAATSLLVLFLGWKAHDTEHAVGYLAAVWLGMFATDVVVGLWPQDAIGFPIKRPVWQEAGVVCLCTLMGLVFIVVLFSRAWSEVQGPLRLAVLSLELFRFPIVLAGIYLFCFKYKLVELGMNTRYWYLALAIHLIFGVTTLAIVPQQSHWRGYFETAGIAGGLFNGLVVAALSEEFTRLLLQTRLGAAFQSKGMGLVVASLIWASMHIPGNRSRHPSETWAQVVLLESWTIMPIGFLWGYMTHRTKSLLPAVLVHGLNLWGLQNF